jgi:MFS family permease
MTEYWFARYRTGLPQNQSRGLVALSWKGRAAVAAFVLGMIAGGGLMLFFGLRDQFVIGIPLFVVCAIAGFSFFIWASVAKTDPMKSIYDYRPEMRRRPVDQKSGETK